MDRITKSLLTEFSTTASLTSLDEAAQFDHLAAYLSVSRYLAESVDITDVMTGKGGDIATIVNGVLVTDPEMVSELVEINGYLDVTFIFVQADRGAGFDTAKLGQFAFGVRDFFAEEPKLVRNESITLAAEVMDAVYSQSSKLRQNPECHLYYVTTGRWVGDANLEGRRSAEVADLHALGIFSDVDLTPIGADEIRTLYVESKATISREFSFPDRIVAPEMPGVHDAYIGLLPGQEFISLLDDGNGQIMRSIFYENVRDWQEYNPVNSDIRSSLESDVERSRFALMNNGVTIIAASLKVTGNRFTINDYQIVNGGQTSHVLFDCRESIDSTVNVPLRLIATDDEDVVASIVRATNRQTAVKEEQLLALSEFQKKLEMFFATFDREQRLYYERRSKQYNSSSDVEKTRIVTLQSSIRSYASIFLEEPHSTTRNYRLLRERLGATIFGPDHKLLPYYYAASLLYRLEFLFRNGQIDSKLKPARYHILMAAHLLAAPGPPPPPNSNAID